MDESNLNMMERSGEFQGHSRSKGSVRFLGKYSLITVCGMAFISVFAVIVSQISSVDMSWIFSFKRYLDGSSNLLFVWRCALYLVLSVTAYFFAYRKMKLMSVRFYSAGPRFVALRILGYCVLFEVLIVQNSLGAAFRLLAQ